MRVRIQSQIARSNMWGARVAAIGLAATIALSAPSAAHAQRFGHAFSFGGHATNGFWMHATNGAGAYHGLTASNSGTTGTGSASSGSGSCGNSGGTSGGTTTPGIVASS